MGLTPLPFLLSMLPSVHVAASYVGPNDHRVREVVARARAEKKAVLLFFSVGYCPTCTRLGKETFTDPLWKKWSDRNCLLLNIDLDRDDDRGGKLWRELQVVHSDTLILLRSDGRVLWRRQGFIEADTLCWLLDYELKP